MYALKYGNPTHVRVENYVNSFKKMEIKALYARLIMWKIGKNSKKVEFAFKNACKNGVKKLS